MDLSRIQPADTIEQLFRRFDLEDGKISANTNDFSKKNNSQMGSKNREKREELQNRDISGLRKLTEKLKREGRGEIYWPLRSDPKDSDEDLDLNKILETRGLFPRKLSYHEHRHLYRTSFRFDRDLQGKVEILEKLFTLNLTYASFLAPTLS